MPSGPNGPLRTVPALLLGHLELQQEQAGRQEPAGAPVAARRRRRRWWRRAAATICPSFASFTDFKTWAEEGPPKGTLYHYPNPHNHQILSVGAAPAPPQDRPSDLHPGDPDQDDRALHAGRTDGKDPGLGRERDRRLHADLSALAMRCRSPDGRAARRRRARQRAPIRRVMGPLPLILTARRRGDDGRRGTRRASDCRARAGVRPAPGAAAQIDHRVPDDAAADPADRAAGDLSGVLFDPSRHPQQVDGALRRLRQLPVPVQARDVLDGGAAVLHLRHHRGDLQGADRLHRRAFRAQHPEPRASASGAACCWCRGSSRRR